MKLKNGMVDHLNRSTLGKIKLTIFEQITGGLERYPTRNEVSQFFEDYIANLDDNNTLVTLTHDLITKNTLLPISYIDETIDLDNSEPEKEFVDGLNNLSEPLLVLGEKVPVDNYENPIVYLYKYKNDGLDVLDVVIANEGFLSGHVYFMLYFIDGKVQAQKFDSELNKVDSLPEDSLQIFANLVLKILLYINHNDYGLLLDIYTVKSKRSHSDIDVFKPPNDVNFDRAIRKVIQGQLICTKAIVDVNEIEFHSFEFAYTYPERLINASLNNFEIIQKNGILTYMGENDKLIVSDDYSTLFAYLIRGVNEVLVINMGPLNDNKVYEIIETGGRDIIPKGVRLPSLEGIDSKTKKLMMAEKIATLKRVNKARKLINDEFDSIKKLIESNNISRCIEILKKSVYSKKVLDEVIQISGRYNKIQEDVRLGLIPLQDETIQLNRLRNSLMKLLEVI